MREWKNSGLVIAAVLGVMAFCGPVQAFSGSGAGTAADPYVITDVNELQEMNNALDAYYVLGNDIDASETSGWNGGTGFEPIGFGSNYFTGSFDGQVHIINGLYINRTPDYGIGLFGLVGSGGTLENVGVVDSYVNGRMAVGALAGHSEGFISNCYAIGTTVAEADVGGLVGYTNKIITQCYSSGVVIAGGRIGGFTSAGGFIGLTRGPDSVISNCYSTAEVKSTSANYQTGGFIGINKDAVHNCFSTGLVTAASGSYAKGFCSLNQGSIIGCYWDKQTSSKTSSSGGTGKTTAEMMQQATFVNWDFVNVWSIIENTSYPFFGEPALLEGLEIVGPGEVAEDFQAQYRAIAHYDNGGTQDVTDLAEWSVEPNDNCSIAAGLLTTGVIDLPEDVTITADYNEGGNVEVDQKQVSIFAICPSGSTLDFDGVDDYVDCGSTYGSVTGSTSKTTMAWGKSEKGVYLGTSLADGGRVVTLYRSDGSSGFSLYAYGDAATWRGLYKNAGNVGQELDSEVSVIPNAWTHIALVQDGSNVYIYVNGVLENAVSDAAAPIMGNPNNADIGCYYNGHGSFFDGTIDDVRIYDRALSGEEILEIMHTRPGGGDPSLVGYWNFDEGTGQVAGDSSVYGNDGQLGSGPGDDDSDPAWVESDAPIGICIPVALDIKPGGCPNPLNLKGQGVLSVAILGSDDFDVSMIDIASVRLEDVAAIRSSYEDVAVVTDGEECECSEDGQDGYIDLSLKFRAQDIVEELIMNRPDELIKGQTLALTLRGELVDGTGIEGIDCVVLVGNVPKWLAAVRLDYNEDGVVNFLDFAAMAEYWLEDTDY